MKQSSISILGIFSCLLLSQCTPQPVVRGSGTSEGHCPPVSEQLGDTLGYTISFSDEVRQADFIESFRSFLDHYPFLELKNDTAAAQIVIRLAPVDGSSRDDGSRLSAQPVAVSGSNVSQWEDAGLPVQQTSMPDNGAAVATTLPFADTVEPVIGGTLRCFSQRSGIDEPFLPLVTIDPFSPTDSTLPAGLSIATIAPKKLTLQIVGRLTDGNGRLISALDIIEAWTSFVKKHPAEGYALFRYVEGIREFIAGKEAVVRGFGAADQKTVYMKFTQVDSLAALRIKSSRLCAGGYLKIGRYVADKSADGSVVLLPNSKTMARRVNCDTLKILTGEDRNPILSFSLKKFDVLPLTSMADLSYARTTLEKQAALWSISHDRYFIACATGDEKIRMFLASKINSAELLRNVVKAEGAPLAAIESDVLEGVGTTSPVAGKPVAPSGGTVRILYRKDDPVASVIAEKVLADLSGSAVHGVLVPSAPTEYERALVDRNYDCAVGWVSDNVRTDVSERLRLASIWFADVASEESRIASRHEIPLFSVDRYLLMRKPAGLYRNAIEGIYSASRPIAGR